MGENSKLITVECPKHHKVLTDGVWNYLNMKRKVDLSISCHQRSIEAHQMILELFVPTLVNPELSENSSCKMSNVDLGHAAQHIGDLETIVEFAYRGQVTFPYDRLGPLLKTAKKLEVQLLIDAIEKSEKLSADILGVDIVSEEASFQDKCNNVTGGRKSRRECKEMVPKLVKQSLIIAETTNVPEDQQECTPTIKKRKTRGSPRRVEPTPCKPQNTCGGQLDRQRRLNSVKNYKPLNCNETKADCKAKKVDLHDEEVFIDDNCSSLSAECLDSESLSSAASESNWTPNSLKDVRLPRKRVAARGKSKRGGSRIAGGPRTPNSKRAHEIAAGQGDQTTVSRAEYKKLWRKNRPVQKCPHCPYETRDKLRYKVHQSKHDPSVVIFKCEICSATFQTKDSLNRHELTHVGTQEIYRCPQCPYSSPKKINYHRHITAIHKIAADGQRLEEKYKCAECNFMCMYKSQFTLHVKMRHSSDKPFKCPNSECTYCSIRKGDLEKHVNTVHLHVRAYMCEICGHKSTHQGALNRHRVSHTGVKLYKCTYDFCEKRYGHADQLKNHLLCHAAPEEKPYVCHLCGHGCRRRDNLQMHLRRIHRTTLNNEALL